jgi:signal recognition particle receptor subunit beta
VNCFFGEKRHSPDKVRDALDLDPDVPVVLFDARDRQEGKRVLVTLVEHIRDRSTPHNAAVTA